MKMIKRASILLMVLLITLASACYAPTVMPYGVWQSEDPELILDINPDIRK